MQVVGFASSLIPRRHYFSALAFTAVFLFVLHGLGLRARAEDQPQPPGPTAATTVQSKISAIVEFSLPALDRALERRVPRRLATFDERTTRCWHRRIFRREVDIDCAYSGFVERTGPISLRAERGAA